MGGLEGGVGGPLGGDGGPVGGPDGGVGGPAGGVGRDVDADTEVSAAGGLGGVSGANKSAVGVCSPIDTSLTDGESGL